ncbi:MAG TPA: hypothetical protein VFC99_17975, partial [Acidimicrobiia bacterium]|nr:hypothetical protein [Acidimicrobiia bacterium]
HTLNFDETFTAMAARRPLGDLLDFLRHHDSHPPLDYLLRGPFAATGSDVLVRLPSVVFSTAALAVFAWWSRAWGRAGLLATGLMAVSGFEVFYGREARMYALMELVGVVVAVGAYRWTIRRTTAPAAVVGCALLVGVFTHVSGLLLAAGAFGLAGLARDRAAWRWRVATAAPVLLWAAAWGPSVLDQHRGAPVGWIPFTTPAGVAHAVAEPLLSRTSLAWLVVAAVVAGAVVVTRSERRLATVGLACFVVPAAIAAVIGLFEHFFIARTLAFGAWAPLAAIAFLLDAAVRRYRALGVLVVAVVGVFVLSSTAQALRNEPLGRIDALTEYLHAELRPGDVVSTPAWERTLVEWPVAVQGDAPTRAVHSPLHAGFALQLEGRATGRVWIVESADDHETVAGARACARPWGNDAVQVHCLRVPS